MGLLNTSLMEVFIIVNNFECFLKQTNKPIINPIFQSQQTQVAISL